MGRDQKSLENYLVKGESYNLLDSGLCQIQFSLSKSYWNSPNAGSLQHTYNCSFGYFETD
jgi:hypothetical protein